MHLNKHNLLNKSFAVYYIYIAQKLYLVKGNLRPWPGAVKSRKNESNADQVNT